MKKIKLILSLIIILLPSIIPNNNLYGDVPIDPEACIIYDCYGGPKYCVAIYVGGGQYSFCHKYDDIVVYG